MKSLSTLIKEKLEGSIKPTKEWAEKHYKKFNKELFNNELPDSIRLSIYEKGPENALGWQGFDKTFIVWKSKQKNGMYRSFKTKPGKSVLIRLGRGKESIEWDENNRYEEITNCKELEPYIVLNAKYDFSKFQLEDTLIHEMVHLWVSKDGLQPKRAHGKEFKAKCNEIRKKAKELYGIEYQLGTKAKHEDTPEKDYQISDEWKKQIKDDIIKSAERGGGIFSVYLIYDKKKMPQNTLAEIKLLKYTKRFAFCRKNRLEIFLEQAKKQKGVKEIWVSPTAYLKLANKYGKFKTMQNWCQFWDPADYDEDALLDNAEKVYGVTNESINEGFKDVIKKFVDKVKDIFVKIKAGTPTSDFDLEDYIEDIEKVEDDEVKGCPETDKKIIEDK